MLVVFYQNWIPGIAGLRNKYQQTQFMVCTTRWLTIILINHINLYWTKIAGQIFFGRAVARTWAKKEGKEGMTVR